MDIRSLCRVFGIVLAGASSTALAHHSVEASFDVSNPFVLEGTVEEIVWANPHAYLFVTVTRRYDVQDRGSRVEAKL